jgi:hypothetical protein
LVHLPQSQIQPYSLFIIASFEHETIRLNCPSPFLLGAVHRHLMTSSSFTSTHPYKSRRIGPGSTNPIRKNYPVLIELTQVRRR